MADIQGLPNLKSLRRKVRSDAGCERVMSDALIEELRAQFATYPTWSYQLHADNLRALVEERPEHILAERDRKLEEARERRRQRRQKQRRAS